MSEVGWRHGLLCVCLAWYDNDKMVSCVTAQIIRTGGIGMFSLEVRVAKYIIVLLVLQSSDRAEDILSFTTETRDAQDISSLSCRVLDV